MPCLIGVHFITVNAMERGNLFSVVTDGMLHIELKLY